MTEVARRDRKARPRKPRPAPSRSDGPSSEEADTDASSDASELLLARRVALFAPLVTLAAAGVVGATFALGPALLVLAGGALFGTIGFFWASLRTLSGEAPLAEGFEHMSQRRIESPHGASERKRTALRALKDLELERSIGKIDEGDYAELSTHYREEAKAILREMDRDISPLRERAESLAKSYLVKHGAAPEPSPRPAPPKETVEDAVELSVPLEAAKAPASRRACWSCTTSNEVDADFCKKCGSRVAPRECPACSVRNEPDAAFCKKCGKSLDVPRMEKTDASA